MFIKCSFGAQDSKFLWFISSRQYFKWVSNYKCNKNIITNMEETIVYEKKLNSFYFSTSIYGLYQSSCKTCLSIFGRQLILVPSGTSLEMIWHFENHFILTRPDFVVNVRSGHCRCSTALKKFAKLFGKVYDGVILSKKGRHSRCFTVNFRTFFKTPFLQKTSGQFQVFLVQASASAMSNTYDFHLNHLLL